MVLLLSDSQLQPLCLGLHGCTTTICVITQVKHTQMHTLTHRYTHSQIHSSVLTHVWQLNIGQAKGVSSPSPLPFALAFVTVNAALRSLAGITITYTLGPTVFGHKYLLNTLKNGRGLAWSKSLSFSRRTQITTSSVLVKALPTPLSK